MVQLNVTMVNLKDYRLSMQSFINTMSSEAATMVKGTSHEFWLKTNSQYLPFNTPALPDYSYSDSHSTTTRALLHQYVRIVVMDNSYPDFGIKISTASSTTSNKQSPDTNE